MITINNNQKKNIRTQILKKMIKITLIKPSTKILIKIAAILLVK